MNIFGLFFILYSFKLSYGLNVWIGLNKTDLWNHDNDVLIFVVDKNSYSQTDNCKNNFLVLGEETTDDINDSIGTAGKKFSLNSTKAKKKKCLSLHCNGDSSYFLLHKKTYKFKADKKDVNFPSQFCWGNLSRKYYWF